MPEPEEQPTNWPDVVSSIGFFAMISFLAYLLFLYATSQQG